MKAQSMRTCIGCRRRATRQSLLRVVMMMTEAQSPEEVPVIVPDLSRSAEGRGAWLHIDGQCVDKASRRGAFGRALKKPGPVDVRAVERVINERKEGLDTNGTSAQE